MWNDNQMRSPGEEPYYTPNMTGFREEIYLEISGKKKSKKKSRKTCCGCLALACILIVIATICSNVSQKGFNPSSNNASTSNDQSSTSVTGQTPYPTPKVLTINRQLECVSQCKNFVARITVISFALDTARDRTLMQLELYSQQNCANCWFTGVSALYGLQLQTSTGDSYRAGGQLDGFGEFSLVHGQPLKLTAIYSFIPSPGSTCTLTSAEIWWEGSTSFSGPIYGSAQFDF